VGKTGVAADATGPAEATGPLKMTFALVTCSGISNTGKLTTQAAIMLMQRKPEQYVWMHAKQSARVPEEENGDAEQVIIIDGCTDCCATKKLSKCSHTTYHHIIATELGIEKKGMAEVQYDEIEKLVAAIDQKINGR
jgi:uncharacterized metal-binding protein